MADNFDVTAGTGTTIRAVEKSSKKTQVVSLDLGGAGAESLLTTTLPVSLASVPSHAVTNAGTFAVQATDAGPSQTITRTYTTSADMSTAAAITAAPTSGQKIVATDILISCAVAMAVDIEMETTANILAMTYIPANGTVQISLRGCLKGDAADKKLYAKASVAGAIRITAVYYSEA
jgi:hypothetical protein